MPSLLERRLERKRQACELLGINPARVRLRRLPDGEGWRGSTIPLYGRADPYNRIICTKGNTGIITYVHELLHILYPNSKPHWWVFGASWLMADRPARSLAHGRRSAARITVPVEVLLANARRQARRRSLT